MGCKSFEEEFYGSVTVGDKGQIVIPVAARHGLGIAPGDKLLVMKHPIYEGLMMFKIDAVREFLDEFSRMVSYVEQSEDKQGGGIQ